MAISNFMNEACNGRFDLEFSISMLKVISALVWSYVEISWHSTFLILTKLHDYVNLVAEIQLKLLNNSFEHSKTMYLWICCLSSVFSRR